MATVNIIVAAYNRSKLLKECIESLLAQTYRDLEIHVVDDGSTDDTRETIRNIMSKDSRIKYSYRPHHGAPASRNFGLTKATGEFIGFFDSDDLWPPNYIEIMVKNLQANPDFDAAYSKIMLLSDGETDWQYFSVDKPPTGHITTDLFFRGKVFNVPSSTILRKSAFAGVLWEEKIGNCDDFDIYLRISTKSKFMYVPDVCMTYRKTEDSISASARRNLFTYHMYVMERFYFYLGGSSYVPRKLAMKKLSHLYRSLALKNYREGNRKATIDLLKKALCYLPLDLRLYVNLFRAFLMNPKNDKKPDWQMPQPLPAIPASIANED